MQTDAYILIKNTHTHTPERERQHGNAQSRMASRSADTGRCADDLWCVCSQVQHGDDEHGHQCCATGQVPGAVEWGLASEQC